MQSRRVRAHRGRFRAWIWCLRLSCMLSNTIDTVGNSNMQGSDCGSVQNSFWASDSEMSSETYLYSTKRWTNALLTVPGSDTA